MRGVLEVADVFRHHGATYRDAQAGHLSGGQRRVMGAIEACRSATLVRTAVEKSATVAAG